MTKTVVFTDYSELENAINQAEINPINIKKIIIYYDED